MPVKDYKPVSESIIEAKRRKLLIDINKNLSKLSAIEESNPLLRFRKRNQYQLDFIALKTKFQAFFGGNKTGKTATITYKLVLMALGKCKGYYHRAKKGAPLKFIFIGPDKDVITDSIVPEIEKWLHPWQIKKKAPGGKIEKIIIYQDQKKEVYTEVLFKSAMLGSTAIVSYNVHAAFIDEPCQEEILNELIGRCVKYSAPIIMGFTRTPKHSGGKFAWLKQLYNGIGRFKRHKEKGKIGSILASIEDNKLLSQDQIEDFVGTFAKDSPEYRMRVYGIPEEAEGLVYNFLPIKDNKPWNVISLTDMLSLEYQQIYDISSPTKYTCYGAIDYGKSAPWAGLNILCFANEQILIVNEGYARQLEIPQQMELFKEIFNDWNVRPKITVADDQIASGDEVNAETIFDQYVAELGDFTTLDASYSYKRGKIHSISKLGRLMTTVNPKTGVPYLQILEQCYNLIRELSDLTWSKTASLTTGDDHAESCLRYFLASGFRYYNVYEASRINAG